MPDIDMTMQARGPLFRKSNQIVDKVSRGFLQYAVELGEERLKEQANPKPMGVFLSVQEARPNQDSRGNYSRNIQGEVTSNTAAYISDGGVTYGSWLEGTSSRNNTTQFKGYALFRKTSTWLQKEVYKHRKRFEREYARRLNGV